MQKDQAPGGIFVVDKPEGFTSFDVVAKMRGICGTRKIGHGGTLDPMATGVLPVFVGAAAKAVDLQPRQEKTYEAHILFGLKTDTGDVTGQPVARATADVQEADLQRILPDFLGRRSQLPPLYSAVKVKGKPLYQYAREGNKNVERKPREIEIFSCDFLGKQNENCFGVRVCCSKGTYIRTLAEEIGEALRLPATLAALRRSGAGVFDISAAHTLDELQKAKDEGRLYALQLPVETLFRELPALQLSPRDEKMLMNGVRIHEPENLPPLRAQERYRIYAGERFLGLAVYKNGALCAEKIFFRSEAQAQP